MVPRASYPGRMTPESNEPERVLPAFPLGTVLVPGLVLPLHIFEQRYRDLVRDLLALPEEEREFVVVAIKDGHEIGSATTPALYGVGTIASVREVSALADGRFDVVTVGSSRVRIGSVLDDRSYLQVRATPLIEKTGAEAQALASQVRAAFATYRGALTDDEESIEDLPEDPGVLSYLVAAAVVLDLPDRQALLELPDDSTRLRAELRRLRQEIALLRVLPSLPAIDLHSTPHSPN